MFRLHVLEMASQNAEKFRFFSMQMRSWTVRRCSRFLIYLFVKWINDGPSDLRLADKSVQFRSNFSADQLLELNRAADFSSENSWSNPVRRPRYVQHAPQTWNDLLQKRSFLWHWWKKYAKRHYILWHLYGFSFK